MRLLKNCYLGEGWFLHYLHVLCIPFGLCFVLFFSKRNYNGHWEKYTHCPLEVRKQKENDLNVNMKYLEDFY